MTHNNRSCSLADKFSKLNTELMGEFRTVKNEKGGYYLKSS